MHRFSASRYFEQALRHETTVSSIFAAPIRMIVNQPRQFEVCRRMNQLPIELGSADVRPVFGQVLVSVVDDNIHLAREIDGSFESTGQRCFIHLVKLDAVVMLQGIRNGKHPCCGLRLICFAA